MDSYLFCADPACQTIIPSRTIDEGGRRHPGWTMSRCRQDHPLYRISQCPDTSQVRCVLVKPLQHAGIPELLGGQGFVSY